MHRIGTLPFDIKDDAVALLFVTSQTRGRWILPKGLAKTGETHAETCAREAFEEAGIKGQVLEDFPITVPITKQTDDGKQAVPVTYYPMLVNDQSDDWPEVETRERHWALIDDSPKVAFREDIMGLVQQFEALMPWIKEAAKQSRS
ncbi:MAG: NUDIX domain-containing protein [Rhizobiaceae bacterium]